MTSEKLYIQSKGQLKALGFHLRSLTAGGAYGGYLNDRQLISVAQTGDAVSINIKKPDGSWAGERLIADLPELKKFVLEHVKPLVGEG